MLNASCSAPWSIAPSPSQKKIEPGRRYSSTCRTFGITVFGVPVMMLTAIELEDSVDLARRVGADEYMTKLAETSANANAKKD